MVYELRAWFDNRSCLYTDDRRIKDLALRSPDLQIIATYFRNAADHQPFAWDIVGQPEILTVIAHRFGQRRRPVTKRGAA
jgi:hypothetical protein